MTHYLCCVFYYYWQHKPVPAAQSGCTNSPKLMIHMYSLKNVEEIPGNTRKAGKDCRRATTQHQGWYLFLLQGETGGPLPVPYKMSSSRLLVCMFLNKLSKTDSMRAAPGPSTACAQRPLCTVQLDWHL